jgi:hypothetical protein
VNTTTVARLRASPYADVVSRARCLDAEAAFVRARCRLLDITWESPLSTVVSAGQLALPVLLKFASVCRAAGGAYPTLPVLPGGHSAAGGAGSSAMGSAGILARLAAAAAAGGGGGHADGGSSGAAAATANAESSGSWGGVELPVDVPLPPQLHFHSIFACPVSRTQCPPGNPPMLLACGHVVSRESLARLAAGRPRFKCPTCPALQTQADAVELVIE